MAKRRRTGPLKPASPKVPRRGERYPFVALVGRPNTGKSTLFNRLVGKRLAITEPTAGTTRDRLAAMVELEDGRMIELCDMGGVGGTGDAFDKDVNRQVDLAMDYADLILLLVDARAGLVPLDEQIARRLKKLKKPVLMVANKVETQAIEHTTGEFYALGLEGDVIPVSAIEGTGKGDLLEAISQALPVEDEGEPLEDEGERLIRIAIVGKRNVGKSTYVNHLFGSERVIASDTAGTTRDAIDVRVTVAARDVVLIDTAGVRKRGRVDDHIEVISHGRAQIAIQRCDVALLFIDCLENVTQLDKKLAGVIAAEHKACVVVANKWDLVEDRMDLEKYADYIHHELPGLRHAPLAAISAKDGMQATAPISLAFDLFAQSCTRIGTGPLNRALGAALTLRRPKPLKNKIGKIYFGTQIATNPVTLLIFVNDPMLFKQSYRRYLVGQLRKSLPWGEIPIKLVFRARESLYKRGGGLARRVKKLPGLAEEARWIDDAPSANAQEMGESLDAEDVQAVLLDAFGNDEPADHPDDDEGET